MYSKSKQSASRKVAVEEETSHYGVEIQRIGSSGSDVKGINHITVHHHHIIIKAILHIPPQLIGLSGRSRVVVLGYLPQ
jgi:hypothetical protein